MKTYIKFLLIIIFLNIIFILGMQNTITYKYDKNGMITRYFYTGYLKGHKLYMTEYINIFLLKDNITYEF